MMVLLTILSIILHHSTFIKSKKKKKPWDKYKVVGEATEDIIH
jgi:hypothetical protein